MIRTTAVPAHKLPAFRQFLARTGRTIVQDGIDRSTVAESGVVVVSHARSR